MNKKVNIINLTAYVSPEHTDLISGREFGEQKARNTDLLKKLENQETFKLTIDDKYVKAINDSFIKGFFNEVFKKLKSKEVVKEYFEIESNDYFKKLFEKNFTILDALYNH